MRTGKLFAFFLIAIGLMLAEKANAQTSNFRILIHGTSTVTKNLGLAAWMVAPNVTSEPNNWFAIVGPRYDAKDFWFEGMAGLAVHDGGSTPLIDVRSSYTGLNPLITLWTNLQWIGPMKDNQYYGYLEIDHWEKNFFAVGIETEDTWTATGDDLSLGPHLIFQVGKMSIILAQQVHSTGPAAQTWVRVVLNL